MNLFEIESMIYCRDDDRRTAWPCVSKVVADTEHEARRKLMTVFHHNGHFCLSMSVSPVYC